MTYKIKDFSLKTFNNFEEHVGHATKHEKIQVSDIT